MVKVLTEKLGMHYQSNKIQGRPTWIHMTKHTKDDPLKGPFKFGGGLNP